MKSGSQVMSDENMEILEPHRIVEAPQTVYYIPEFITEDEEADILRRVYDVPKPKWTYLKNRRLQDYGGIPHKNGMIVEEIPKWLQAYMDKVSDLNTFGLNRANHVLVNEYKPGQGIMPHVDGHLFYPTITTISVGSHAVLGFLTQQDGYREDICTLLLEQRSLVIIQNDMYKKYLHYINEINVDVVDHMCANLKYSKSNVVVGDVLQRQTRVSLTIRNVPKLARVNLLNVLMKKKK